MSKTRDTGYLANVIQVHDTGVRIMSGSTMLMAISSSGAVTITGELSGSDAANSLLLDGTGSLAFTTTASFLVVSASQQQISSSLLQVSASYISLSASYTTFSGSASTRISNNETASNSLTNASASFSTRTTQVEKTYATTGSNTYTGTQNFSSTCTPNGFNSGASINTAGGLQVTNDAYFSSSVFIKGNVTVYGTQSVAYISSSQLNIGTNTITVNTFTPSVRFGGLSVFDSGSTGLTGSIFWDSELNRWIYVNASGSGGGATYGGGMFISGPRNTQGMGCEQGTTACMLMVGQGGDHMTSSLVYHDSTVTCIPGAIVGGTMSGTTIYGSTAVCAPTIQSANVCTDGSYASRVVAYGSNVGMFVNSTGAGEGFYRILNGACSIGALSATGWYKGSAEQNMGIITGPSKSFQIATNDCANSRLTIGADGVSVFACQVCAPAFVGGIVSGTTVCASNGVIGNNSNNLYLSSNSATGEISFWGNQLNTRLMTLNGCGNLGIGTATPLFVAGFTTLHVNGTTNGLVYVTGTCSTGGHLYAGNGGVNVGASTPHPLAINTNDTARITISSTGIATFACQVCAPALIVSNPGTACTVTDVLTLTTGQSGGSSVCAGAAILFTGNNGATVARIYSRGNMNFNNGSDLVFQTQVSAGGTPQCTMFINGGSQNVGIGTTSLTQKFTIAGSFVRMESRSTDNTNAGVYYTVYNGASVIGQSTQAVTNTGDYLITTGTSSETERLRITSTGIACFSCQVCANAFIASSGIRANNGSITSCNGTIGGAAVFIADAPDNTSDIGYRVHTGGSLKWFIGLPNNVVNDNFSIFQGGCSADRLTIDTVGNVGIGISSPVTTNLNGALTIWKCYNNDGASVPSTTAQTYYSNQHGLYLFGRNSGLSIISANSEEGSIKFGNASTNAYATIGTTTGTSSIGGDMYFRVGSDTERLRIFSTGVSCFACQVCAPSGVKFGNGSTILNYYEQGTWTPRVKNGSFTTNVGGPNAAWYVRVGNIVTVGGTLSWTGGTGAQDGNSLQIACLPFASGGGTDYRSVGQFGAPATDSIGFKNACAQMTLVIDPGASFIYIIQNYQNGTYLTYTHSPCVNTSGTVYGFQATYQV